VIQSIPAEAQILPGDPYFHEFGQRPIGTQMVQMPMEDPYFSRPSNLEVIREYNDEKLAPFEIKRDFWGLFSKSVKLGFWEKEDEFDIFLHKNVIKLGHIMAKPKHMYTFADRQKLNMIDFLVYSDFKRGVGMEKYKINERTLQATSVTQTIQGSPSGGKKGGVLAALKSIFS
jgi:hypothetical protein